MNRKSPLQRRAISATQAYLVDVGFACAGVVVKGEKVVEAAPVFRWMMGRHWPTIRKWNKIISVSHTCEGEE